MRHQQSKTAGFTVIEIMIAVAVIGLLAALPKIIVTEAQLSGRGVDYQFSQPRNCDSRQIAENGSIVMQTRNTGASTDPLVQLVPSVGASGGLVGTGPPVEPKDDCPFLKPNGKKDKKKCKAAGYT